MNVYSSLAQFDQGAGRAKFAAIKPEAEQLRSDLQKKDASDDGESEHGASLF